MQRISYRILTLLLLLAIAYPGANCHAGEQPPLLEQSICGFKEPLVFWLWNAAAGKPAASRPDQAADIEAISITTADGRTLHGYRLGAAPEPAAPGRPGAYLLVAQGNAMLADQLIRQFSPFAAHGYDVYIFDYRGYGLSEGKRRLKAMLSDYLQIIHHLDTQPYKKRAFYGMSFGGVVLLDALRQLPGVRRVVIDSTPSRLSGYGCPAVHDPVNNLPQDAGRLLVIAGARDRVVKPAASRELLALAERRGATVIRPPDWGHPFMDSHTTHRLEAVRRFLMQE